MHRRLEQFVDRFPWLDVPIAVSRRTTDLNGSYAASAITLVAFLSLFPLLLVTVSIVGFVSGANHQFADDLIRHLGLTGHAAVQVRQIIDTAHASRGAASVFGFLGLLWSGLALAGAFRYIVNLPWQVTIEGFRARLLGIPWLAGSAVVLGGSLALSAVVNWLPGWAWPVAILVGLAVDTALFAWTFWFLGVPKVGLRPWLPGACAAAVGFGLLKLAGAIVVPRLIANSSALYGSIGVVFATLVWLLLFGRLLVYASVLNAVLMERAGVETGIDG